MLIVRQIFPLVLFSKVVLGISFMYSISGSDVNKNVIVEKGGADKLVNLSARFSDHPLVLQERMQLVQSNLEPGTSMKKFHQLQRSSCFMIRVRNAENRKFLLNNGIEQLIRKAKQTLKNCKAAATDALRDLGLDNYNS
ncbi:uncharacterized protein LOC121758336 isoform X1 [Salvia splendens]|uniref:uncharacterized protein LOC121758336 isoform X1 n=1 Tax=Salvia splendens TaxID=180675 RepID=UPI001C26DDC2|nr:uncharacterized protein LOC121758336 isoform X1 [Salvia splendens]